LSVGGITTLGGLQLQGPNVGGQTRATLISEFAGLNTGGASALAWNYSSGGGETDWFINRDGGGIGGLNIYDFPDTSGSPTNIFTLTGAGNLTIPGTVTGAASYWTGSVGIGTAAPTTALQVNGTVTAALFSGSGIGLTGISTANLSATGTANSTTYLRGDNTWASVSGGSLPALTNGDIWVGNGSNVASAVAISGDVSLTNAGATTVGKIQGTSITGTTGTGKVVLSASPSLTGTVSASTGFSAAGSAGVSSVPTPQTGSSGICMGGSLSFIFVGGLITNINTDDSNCATNNPDNGGGDLAEYYGTQGERPERGDIVALADQTNSFDLKIRNPAPGETDKSQFTVTSANVKKATADARNLAIGVVPTSPGQMLGAKEKMDKSVHPQLVALSGHVPVKMTLDGGDITIGDPITVSTSTPGAGMRATTSGRIVGYALAPFTAASHPKSGMIEVFMTPSEWIAPQDIAAPGKLNEISDSMHKLQEQSALLKAANNNEAAAIKDLRAAVDAQNREIKALKAAHH
jgi:hypothetical protein